MKRIYAPWRNSYIKKTDLHSNKTIDCPFCLNSDGSRDEDRFILYQSSLWMIIMNKYPYNAGHVLIVPNAHVSDISTLSLEAQQVGFQLLGHTCAVLKKTLGAEGVNVGINLGMAAGASIVDHLHIHVLPRWIGDTNFFPTIAQVKHISLDMNQIYVQLREAFLAHSFL